MIREHALLDVRAGHEEGFEQTFAEATALIASTPGFRSLSLDRSIERPGRYLLLVEWDRVEDHTDGFRGSPRYDEWRTLLHHFYDPSPEVTHYQPVLRA